MTASNVAATNARPPKVFMSLSRLVNPLVIGLAGTRLMPLYGVIYHRGRRSGKVYRTPVVVRHTRDGFIIPMPWGEGTDWLRNVRAAGGCNIRWKARMYAVDSPEVMDMEAARNAFSGVQQKGLTRFGIKQVVKMHLRG
jgi:deazaflavin-dependent oxidoreductase (nitroreductase family)